MRNGFLLERIAIFQEFFSSGIFYLIPFLIAMGVNNFTIGLANSIAFLASFLAPIALTPIFEKFGIKKISLKLGFVFLFPALALILLIIFSKKIIFNLFLILFFIAYAILYFIETAFSFGITSIIPRVIEARQRASFIASRLRNIFIINSIAFLTYGAILEIFKFNPLNFAIVISIATLFKFIAILNFQKLKFKEKKHKCKFEFKIPKINNSFYLFLSLIGLVEFSIMIATPFITPYLLKELKLSYLFFGLTLALGALGKLVFFGISGKISDRYSNENIIIYSLFGVSIVPILYAMIKPALAFLAIIPAFVAGSFWSFYSVANSNLIFKLASGRINKLGIYMSTISAIAFLAPLIGGFLADKFFIFGLSGFIFIFILSSILRFISLTVVSTQIQKIPERKHKLSFIGFIKNVIQLSPSEEVAKSFLHLKKVLLLK